MTRAGALRLVWSALAATLTICAAIGQTDSPFVAQAMADVPGTFGKIAPANGALVQTSMTLSWGASAGADTYDYCIDAINDNFCNNGWMSAGANTSVLALFITDSTFYWQVRARNISGTTVADGGAWWTLRISSPPRAFFKTAPLNGVTTLSTTPILDWDASVGMTRYDYCVDAILNNSCDNGWFSNGLATSVAAGSFSPGATLEWQIRAVNGIGVTTADGGTWWRFTIRQLAPGTYFSDDLEVGDGLEWWRAQWEVTTESAHSGTHAWSDSPFGPYETTTDNPLETPDIDLRGATRPQLTFWHRYNFAADGNDRGLVWVTTDDGNTYTPLQSYMGTDLTWRQATFDLTPYAGAERLRVLFEAFSFDTPDADGWYIDDVVVSEATAPPFVLSHPQSQSVAFAQSTTLTIVASGASPLTYQWYAGTSGDTSAPLAGQTSASYTTSPLTGTARFWVRVSNPFGLADSQTATVNVRFTDEPLAAGVTAIRTVHVSELRARIDGLRVRSGLSAFGWSESIVTGATPVRAQHILELRAALAEVYTRRQLAPPTYTDGALTPGVTTPKVAHLQEIRAAVLALE
jgi:hypothetical protein